MFRRSSLLWVSRGDSVAKFERFELFKDGSIPGVIHMVATGGKLNLMDHKYCNSIESCTEAIDNMGPAARSVVLYAEKGSHFCAGLDLKGMMPEFLGETTAGTKVKVAAAFALGTSKPVITEPGTPAMKNQKLHRHIRRWQDALSSISRCRVPVIACVDKSCIGGGFNVATCCDFRYCTEGSNFSLREVKVGITADIGALQRLPAIVGEGVTRELAFTARDFCGKEAQKLNFANQCFPTYDEALEKSVRVAGEIARNSPIAVQGTKNVLNFHVEKRAQESLDYVRLWNSAFMKSDDIVEAGLAFAQKKQPDFGEYVLPSKGTTNN